MKEVDLCEVRCALTQEFSFFLFECPRRGISVTFDAHGEIDERGDLWIKAYIRTGNEENKEEKEAKIRIKKGDWCFKEEIAN